MTQQRTPITQPTKITHHSLTISSVQELTTDAICVSFEVPEELHDEYDFLPGQYLTLIDTIDGKELRRSYSICAEKHDKQLRVAIKRVGGGLFSNHANDNFKPGYTLKVMQPQGNFYLNSPTPDTLYKAKNYMCLAVGSGITPILSIIKSALKNEPECKVTLIYGNRNTASMLFREELSFLKNAYLDRFQWINIMSKEDQGSDLFKGHIDNKKGFLLQKKQLINIADTDAAFICGPESMMSEVSRGFRIEGLKDEKIHYELFASSSEDAQLSIDKAKQRIGKYGEEKTSKVTLIADGRSAEFDLATVGENILDAGMHQGMELPYSCKAGVCSTCKAKLISGQVEMDIVHGLEPHEIAADLILTCQAHPISDEVVIDFDQR